MPTATPGATLINIETPLRCGHRWIIPHGPEMHTQCRQHETAVSKCFVVGRSPVVRTERSDLMDKTLLVVKPGLRVSGNVVPNRGLRGRPIREYFLHTVKSQLYTPREGAPPSPPRSPSPSVTRRELLRVGSHSPQRTGIVNVNVEPTPTWLTGSALAPYPLPSSPPSPPGGTPRTRPPDPRRDADTGIANRCLHGSVLWRCRDLDPAALRRELDRIGEQVQDDLPDLPLVRLNLTKPRIHGRVQRDAAAPGPLPDQHQEMEIREVQFHPRAAARTELFDYLETAPIWRSSSSSRLP